MCKWGENDPWEWGREVGGHLWRKTGDISDSWNSMTGLLDQQVGEQHSGPNGLERPGHARSRQRRYDRRVPRALLPLALLNAPLLAGNDLRRMDQSTKDMLFNPDLIAINQDWGGKQGYRGP
ncbi:hypothetical protein AB0H34_36905 [Saccharopolyspora shandongensis]|uniref:hypothetical protein n=1 Tax=Saccharopolyspora shandongensis TaxID=418495 RepID=UPI003411E8CC